MSLQVHMSVLILTSIVLGGCSRDLSSTSTARRSGQSESEDNLAPQDSSTATESASLYTVNTYDPQADPAEDLARTVSLASTRGKRIILQIGGDW